MTNHEFRIQSSTMNRGKLGYNKWVGFYQEFYIMDDFGSLVRCPDQFLIELLMIKKHMVY